MMSPSPFSADNAEGPLGPLTQAFINKLWNSLFDPTSPVYLPNLLQNGDPSLNLPVNDPLTPSGVSQPVDLTGTPADVANSACTSTRYPILPIASATPQVQLMNVKATGLRAVSSGGPLTYSPTAPLVTGVLQFGSLAGQPIPLVLSQNDPAQPNFSFHVSCCVPVSQGSTTCSATQFPANASGAFTATLTSVAISTQLQVNIPPGSSLSIQVTVTEVAVTLDPSDITIEVVPSGLPAWAQGLAQNAVDTGVASGAFLNGINAYLKSPYVTQSVAALLNKLLAGLLPSAS